jgi:RNA polymerase sigma-70 factor (sigma-E family)
VVGENCVSEGDTGAAVTDASGVPLTTLPETFEEFYRRSRPGAVRLAGLLTQDARSAEDLAQEAFTRVFPKWSQIENPSAYLRTTVVNVCRTWRARDRNERSKLDLLGLQDRVELGFDGLADAVAALPFRQRAVLVLRYYDDLSEAEIAQTLGCRPGTVKSLASRALKTLEKVVDQ